MIESDTKNNKDKYILWISGGNIEGAWGCRIAEKIEQHGFKVIFLTNMRKTFKALVDLGAKCYLLEDMAKAFRKNYSGDELSAIENTHPYPGFNILRTADFTIRDMSINDANDLIASCYCGVERLFDKYNFCGFVMFPTGAIQGRIPFSVAKSRNIKTLIPFWGPVHNDTFVIADISEEWIWSELYKENFEDKNDIAVDSVVKDIENRLLTAKQPSSKNRIKQLARIIHSYFTYLININKFNDFEKGALLFNLRIEQQSFKRYSTKHLFRYDRFVKDAKYVFFPMHCHYDSTLTAVNPMFTEQVALSKIIAKTIPAEYTLYVKEHPYDEGYLKIGHLKELRKTGNIKILHPSERSIDIIKNSAAVVTVSSSAGWESLLFKVPVITLGNVFYTVSPVVYKITDIKQLKGILWKALKKGRTVYKEMEEQHWSALARIIKTSRLGNSQGYKSSFGWEFDSDKNADYLAKGLIEKLTEVSARVNS